MQSCWQQRGCEKSSCSLSKYQISETKDVQICHVLSHAHLSTAQSKQCYSWRVCFPLLLISHYWVILICKIRSDILIDFSYQLLHYISCRSVLTWPVWLQHEALLFQFPTLQLLFQQSFSASWIYVGQCCSFHQWEMQCQLYSLWTFKIIRLINTK